MHLRGGQYGTLRGETWLHLEGQDPARVAKFLDTVAGLGIDGVMTSPGYAYERAPDQQHFLNRTRTKELFRAIFRLGKSASSAGVSW